MEPAPASVSSVISRSNMEPRLRDEEERDLVSMRCERFVTVSVVCLFGMTEMGFLWMVEMAVHLGRELAARRLAKVADRSIADGWLWLDLL